MHMGNFGGFQRKEPMDQTELKRIAKHEALHGLLALEVVGAKVEDIRCEDGVTITSFPLVPHSLKRRYADLPYSTRETVKRIIAAVIAPAIITGEYLDGEDRVLFEEWEQAWKKLPGACSWLSLCTDARLLVGEWYRAPGRRAFVERVAEALMKRRRVWGHSAWVRLVQSCQPPRSAPQSAPRALPYVNVKTYPPEILVCSPDWRTSGHAGTGLVHQSW
jgi:hypothetical protein